MARQNTKIDTCASMVEELHSGNSSLKKKVLHLEYELDEVEQASKSKTLEIRGIPKGPSDDAVSLVKNIGRALDIEIRDEMLDRCLWIRVVRIR